MDKVQKRAFRQNTDLRVRAESFLPETKANDDYSGLDHELELHKIELNLQNEELSRANMETEISRKKYQNLYDFAPIGLFTLASEDLIMEVNLTGAALLGIERMNLFGKPFSNFIMPDNQDSFYLFCRRALTGDVKVNCELKLLKKDRTHFYASVECAQVKGAFDGEGAALLIAISDITEKKRIEEENLKNARLESLGLLASGMAHELNNNLTITQTCIDLHSQRYPVDSPVYDTFTSIKKATEKSANLTRQLLLFGRRQPQFKAPLNLNQNIKDNIKMLDRLIGEDVTINYFYEQDLWMINADADSIDQVLVNLMLNARDAMSKGGTITIKPENVTLGKKCFSPSENAKPGRYVCLSVSDTGAGIDPQFLSRIFEPFFTTKELSRGTGLGLSVVYGIIKEHDGYINVTSEPGHGTTFEIFLPAFEFESQPGKTDESFRRPAQLRGRGEKILLVEDDRDLMNLTRELLADNNYVVHACRGVSDAEIIFAREKEGFDLLISDIILPDGRGSDLALQLRQRQPSLGVVLTSGYADDRDNMERIKQQGLSFLPKPYTAEKLMRQIYEVIQHNS
jgi:two-component system cell cycle sensor histidine kinase/response regulator CckA